LLDFGFEQEETNNKEKQNYRHNIASGYIISYEDLGNKAVEGAVSPLGIVIKEKHRFCSVEKIA